MSENRDLGEETAGRAASPNRLSSPTEPASGLGPAGFDPARKVAVSETTLANVRDSARDCAESLGECIELIEAQAEQIGRLRSALMLARSVAEEARVEWDSAPEGMKAGKLLIALSGALPGYRADIDEIHSTLAAALRDRDGSGEAGQTPKAAGPGGQQPGPEGHRPNTVSPPPQDHQG